MAVEVAVEDETGSASSPSSAEEAAVVLEARAASSAEEVAVEDEAGLASSAVGAASPAEGAADVPDVRAACSAEEVAVVDKADLASFPGSERRRCEAPPGGVGVGGGCSRPRGWLDGSG